MDDGTSLSQGWLTLLDGADDHISDRSLWQSVLSSFMLESSDHVKVLSTGVIAAVDNGGVGESHRDLVFDTDLTGTSSFHC